jgi:hypothetical protein
MTLASVEKAIILNAFKFYRNNKTATAQALGVAIRTLDSKLSKYELEAIDEAAAAHDRQARRDAQLKRARGVITNEGLRTPQEISSAKGVEAK